MSRRSFAVEPLEARTLLAVITWDGGGGDNLWGNPLNWSGDVLPGSADDVVLEIAGPAQEILVDVGLHKIKTFASHEDLRISFGQLRVTGDAWMYGVLTLDGGQLLTDFWKQSGELRLESGDIMGTGGAPFIIAGGGSWTGGRLLGPGPAQITAEGGAFSMSGSLTLGRALTVDVPLVWMSGTVVLQDGGRFELLAGHTLAMTDQTVFGGEGEGVFIRGTLAAAGGRINPGLYCGGPGASIEVTGILTLAYGGLACPVNIGAAGEIWIDSAVMKNVNLQPGVVVSAMGKWRVFEGGLGVYEASVVLPSVRMGTADTFGRVIVKAAATFGEFELVHGKLKLFGDTEFEVTGSLTVGGDASIRVEQEDSGFHIAAGATMSYLTGEWVSLDRIYVRNDGAATVEGGGSFHYLPIHFENHGTLTVVNSVLLAGISGDGVVELLGGFPGTFNSTGSFAGEIRIGEGVTAALGGSFHLAPAGRIWGDGDLQIGWGTFFDPVKIEGTVEVDLLQVEGPVDFAGATLTYSQLALNSGYLISDGEVTLDGTIAWGWTDLYGTGLTRFAGSSVVTLGTMGAQVRQRVELLGRLDILKSASLSSYFDGEFEAMEGSLIHTIGGWISTSFGGTLRSLGRFEKDGFAECVVYGEGVALDGEVGVLDGLLRIGGGSHKGAFAVDDGARLRFAPPSFFGGQVVEVLAGSSIGGPGKLVFANSKSWVHGSLDVGFMVLTGVGNGQFKTVLTHATPKSVGKLQMDKGELAIGAAAGLTVKSYYTHKGGKLRLRIGGSEPGQYASINVGKKLTLSGGSMLSIELQDGYVPKAGDTFDIMTWGQRTGTFSVIELPPVPPDLTATLVYMKDRLQLRIEKP